MAESYFIQLKREASVGERTYAPGSVVAVDKVRRKTLVERGHANDHPGPASEPEPEPTPDSETKAPAKNSKSKE